MKSRIIIYLCAVLTMAAVGSGCNSLDQAPSNKFTDENFWDNPERVLLLANMAYRQMYEIEWIWQDECLSDNMIEMRGTPATRTIRQSQATPNLDLFKTTWENIYKGIKSTNVFLEKVHLVPDFEEASRDRFQAEMRFIRAWIFFRISNLWGDIPFFLNDITLEESYKVARTPRREVIAALHNELDEVIPVLPTRNQIPASENGRISKGAAVALKAKMYMYEGDYENAEKQLELLVKDQSNYGHYALFTTPWTDPIGNLYSAYEALFLSRNEYNSEVILDYSAVSMTREWGNMANMVPHNISGTNLGSPWTAATPTQSLVDAYWMADGRSIDQAEADGDYDPNNPYVNRDPRLDATVVYNGYEWRYFHPGSKNYGKVTINTQNEYNEGENYTRTGYYTRKYYDPDQREDYRQHNNPILMRYADILLLYAEAYHENHGLTKDIWDITIRPIRERAGLEDAALEFPTLSESDMRELIRNERRIELALEGHRYWDIMRWNEGTNLLNGVVYGARFYTGGTNIPVANNKFTDRDRLWSLPQIEMDNVPTLKPNNPGY